MEQLNFKELMDELVLNDNLYFTCTEVFDEEEKYYSLDRFIEDLYNLHGSREEVLKVLNNKCFRIIK